MRIGRRQGEIDLARATHEADAVVLPEAVWKNCPWQPRALVETGLRQWLRCAGVALAHDQIIGMPSNAVDEAWHGFILCTAAYAAFCERAYGTFLHHHPDDGTPEQVSERSGTADEQLRRTVIAWSLVARPAETCVLWDLDARVGVPAPWGVASDRIELVEDELRARQAGRTAG